MSDGMDRKLERRRWTAPRIALAVVALVVIAGVIYGLTRDRQSSLRTRSERIVVSTVTHGAFQEFVPVSGIVVPIDHVFLDAVEGGRVEEIYVESGTMIEQGEPILRLTNTNMLLDIMWREAELFQQSNNLRNTRLLMEQSHLQLRRELADVENRLRQQKRTYERTLALAQEGLIPTHQMELARDEYEYLIEKRELTAESHRKEMEFRQAQIEALEDSLERMNENFAIIRQKQEGLTIRAPVQGHLTALNAEIGQLKTSGERLGQIDVLHGFKVRAPVDEYYIGRIEKGREGEFDLAGERYGVVVDKVYPEVRDGRFDVDLAFAGSGPAEIRRGQRLRARLELSDVTEATLLKRGAFFETTGGAWVYVVDPAGESAIRRSVRLGRQNPEVYEVLEGLEPGEQVITSSYEGYGDSEKLILD